MYLKYNEYMDRYIFFEGKDAKHQHNRQEIAHDSGDGEYLYDKLKRSIDFDKKAILYIDDGISDIVKRCIIRKLGGTKVIPQIEKL